MRVREEYLDIDEIVNNLNDNQKHDLIKERLNYKLNTEDLLKIAKSIESDDIKKEIIKNYEKYNIKKYEMFEIVEFLNKESIKDIIHNHINYSLTIEDIIEIIKMVDEDQFKQEVINDYKNYYFNDEDLSQVIASIKDDEYKKRYILDNKFKLNSTCISKVIGSIKDDNYKYAIVTNYKEYKLESEDIAYILGTFESNDENNKYLLDVLRNKDYYMFDQNILTSIISLINDDSFKEKIILNNIYNLPIELLYKIISSLSTKEKSFEIIEELYNKGVFGNLEVNEHIYFPDDITIGIEIETEGKNSGFLRNNIMLDGWKGEIDATLYRGIEAISPVLHKSDEDKIVKVCALLNKLNQEASRNCAGHIHIGADYFEDDVNSFKVLLEIFTNMEKIIYLISNPEGDVPRDKIFKYSSPITYKVKQAIFNKDINFKSMKDIKDFTLQVQELQQSRYSSINFRNLGIPEKNTIEFRTPNGSIDPDIWIENINLFGNLVCLAKKISNIQNKSFSEMTNSDKLTYYFYEKTRDPKTDDRSKLMALLSTFPREINRKVYLNRYDTNSTLIEGLQTEEVLEAVSSLRPVMITECNEGLKRKIVDNYKKNFVYKNQNKAR